MQPSVERTQSAMASMYSFLLLWSDIELAGIHSGDSACIIPPRGLTEEQIETLKDYTRKDRKGAACCWLMNMQYAIEDGKVFVIEANPRASRTVPLVSKVCGINMFRLQRI